MKLRTKLWLVAIPAVLLIPVFVVVILYVTVQGFPEAQQLVIGDTIDQHPSLVFLPLALYLGGTLAAVHYMLTQYILPIHRLTEETTIQARANPGYRVPETGGPQVRHLAVVINDAARRHQSVLASVEDKISEAQRMLRRENNILTGLVSGLSEGVIVCNGKGEILLYNERARHLFTPVSDRDPDDDGSSEGLIGLGRSLNDVLSADQIEHGLQTLRHRLTRGAHVAPARMMVTGSKGQLLRAALVPVLDDAGKMSGFVLVLYDISDQVEADTQRDSMLRLLGQGLRSSLGSIRAAIESIDDFPSLTTAQRERFQKVILEETQGLSALLDRTSTEYGGHFKSRWSLDTMRMETILTALRRLAEERCRMTVSVDVDDATTWLNADSYAITRTLLHILRKLHDTLSVNAVHIAMVRERRLARLDLSWEGRGIDAEQLNRWLAEAPSGDSAPLPYSIHDILDRHDAEIWCRNHADSGSSSIRVVFPLVPPPTEDPRHIAVLDGERPEFYDFDLFHQSGQTPELDRTPLDRLTFTVFDTETTGLDPTGNDEIISVGAVRVVNGRLLRQEIFDQLVNPGRPIPQQSIEVHGIQPEMLRNQPPIGKVLPAFARFARGTVLVAHNAAFDMRFLQKYETASGARFDQPVLDTLLLSAALHPNQERHNLDALAHRLGVAVVGRHTALGDALVTAEVFLKLIPLLMGAGITTLRAAREASEKTFYARIKY